MVRGEGKNADRGEKKIPVPWTQAHQRSNGANTPLMEEKNRPGKRRTEPEKERARIYRSRLRRGILLEKGKRERKKKRAEFCRLKGRRGRARGKSLSFATVLSLRVFARDAWCIGSQGGIRKRSPASTEEKGAPCLRPPQGKGRVIVLPEW